MARQHGKVCKARRFVVLMRTEGMKMQQEEGKEDEDGPPHSFK